MPTYEHTDIVARPAPPNQFLNRANQLEIEFDGSPLDFRGRANHVTIRDRATSNTYSGYVVNYSVDYDVIGEQVNARMEVHSSSTATNWVIEQRLSDSTSAATYGNIWQPTVRYSASSTTISAVATWVLDGWEQTYTATTTTGLYPYEGRYRDYHVIRPEQILRPVRLSAEERARREAQERQWEEERIQHAAMRKLAESRAENLLLALLTPEQQADYKQHRRFFLQVNGQMFRIDHGRTGNVKRVDPITREVTDSYCIHPSFAHGCPDPDVMLAQKLMLETDPEQFIETANHYRVRPPNERRAGRPPDCVNINAGEATAYVHFNA